MKNILIRPLLPILLFSLFSSCSGESSKTLKSGNAMTDSINDSSSTRLNYRIYTEGVNQHESFKVLTQLRQSDFNRVPLSWPATSMDKVKEAFKFLHLIPTEEFNEVSIFRLPSKTKLILSLLKRDEFSLLLNRNLSSLSWKNRDGDLVQMQRQGQNWIVSTQGHELIWKPLVNEICYQDDCESVKYVD